MDNKLHNTETGQDNTLASGLKNPNIAEVRGLRKSFGQELVLDNLEFDLLQGENLAVIGKSGSGKSVLIKCMVRLLQSDSGSICIFGTDVNGLNAKALDEMRTKIGFLFQSGALYDSMSVRQNIEFPLYRIKKGISRDAADAKVMEALENVGLQDAIDKMPSQLSGGMRKRISLARTLVVDPALILYDEPSTGLDPSTSKEISMLINDIKIKYKASSIIITHDIECVRNTADRILMIKDGLVYKQGTTAEFETSDDPEIMAFFESSKK